MDSIFIYYGGSVIKKIKNVVMISLLSLSPCLQMQATNKEESHQIGVIPCLNAPVKVAYRDWAQFGPLNKIILTGSALLHGTLACTSTAVNIRTKLAQHALLWAASHGVGAVQTFSHELGHTAVNHARGAQNLELELWGDYTTLLTGIYGGYASSQIQYPRIKTCNEEQTITTKEDFLAYIDAYDKYKQDEIKMLLAGPVSGTLSGYGMLKMIQSKYPAVFQNKWFKGICLAGILGQTINFVPLNPTLDGPKAYQAWLQRSHMVKNKELVQGLPEGSFIGLEYKNNQSD